MTMVLPKARGPRFLLCIGHGKHRLKMMGISELRPNPGRHQKLLPSKASYFGSFGSGLSFFRGVQDMSCIDAHPVLIHQFSPNHPDIPRRRTPNVESTNAPSHVGSTARIQTFTPNNATMVPLRVICHMPIF